jgi:hypothetical protein
MVHKYGNYLMSTLFSVCTPLQRQSILEMLGPFIYTACLDTYGIHPMQTLLSLSLSKVEVDYVRKILKDRIPILSQVDNYIG